MNRVTEILFFFPRFSLCSFFKGKMLNGKRGELSFGTVMMVRFTLFAKIELLTPTLLLNISWKVVSSNFSISLPGKDTSHKQSLDTYLLNCEPKLYIFFLWLKPTKIQLTAMLKWLRIEFYTSLFFSKGTFGYIVILSHLYCCETLWVE